MALFPAAGPHPSLDAQEAPDVCDECLEGIPEAQPARPVQAQGLCPGQGGQGLCQALPHLGVRLARHQRLTQLLEVLLRLGDDVSC